MSSIVTDPSNERDIASRQKEDDIVLPIRTNQSKQEKAKENDKMSAESDRSDPKEISTSEEVSLPGNLRKALQRRSSSVLGSNSSHSNDSDNSALVSIGNGSFGFNFDCEDGINSDGKTNDSDSDGNSPPEGKKRGGGKFELISGESNSEGNGNSSSRDWKSSLSSLTQSSDSDYKSGITSHDAAAAAAVANLHSIANAFSSSTDKVDEAESQSLTTEIQPCELSSSFLMYRGKRAASESQDSGGYNSDESTGTSMSSSQHGISRKKGKKLNEEKREERNAREKERSFRISKKIDELRSLLSSGGVVVSKCTKSSVLTEAANYIRLLQQHQFRSEIDRHQLVQQIQLIGGGALGPQASNAIRHVAAQNGVWSLGNFGGVPPKSAMTHYQGTQGSVPEATPSQATDVSLSVNMEEHDYQFVFNSSPVGMAIASMGGALIDCNQLFCQLSNYTKQEICSMTIFNITSRQDLEHAFDLISHMISSPSDGRPTNQKPKPCVLRGSMKDRDDLGLSVALIRGDDGIAKCFCVTLIKNPDSPFDTSRPTPATADLIIPTTISSTKDGPEQYNSAPAYTTG